MQQPMQIQPGLRDPRQRYGLGSFVKKAIRGVKKIAKSPLGKAAMIGALGFGIPGTGIGGLFGRAGFGGAATGMLGSQGIGATMAKSLPSLFANPTGKAALHKNPGFFPKMWSGMSPSKKLFTGASAFALGAPLIQNMFSKGKDVVEEVDEDYIDPYTAYMMAKFKNPQMNFLPENRFTNDYYQTAVPAANGGRIGYADGMIVEDEEDIDIGIPALMKRRGYQGGELVEQESVEEVQLPDQAEQMLQMEYQKYVEGGGQLPYPEFKKLVLQQMREESQQPEVQETMMAENVQQEAPAQGIAQLAAGGMAEQGMIDMGGMEKDYRAEGGFVPLGGEEKADDVPARLSKNEFVFTADAVRAAGGGDIDAGAEVMENVMNNLEQGGQVSQGSQGGGGEEMISEEEMIEGPGGAQEMYEQQQMLQSRMA